MEEVLVFVVNVHLIHRITVDSDRFHLKCTALSSVAQLSFTCNALELH